MKTAIILWKTLKEWHSVHQTVHWPHAVRWKGFEARYYDNGKNLLALVKAVSTAKNERDLLQERVNFLEGALVKEKQNNNRIIKNVELMSKQAIKAEKQIKQLEILKQSAEEETHRRTKRYTELSIRKDQKREKERKQELDKVAFWGFEAGVIVFACCLLLFYLIEHIFWG